MDCEPVKLLQMPNLEIVIDDDYPDRVEIYRLDSANNRIEGGTFKLTAFMDAVLAFYEANY